MQREPRDPRNHGPVFHVHEHRSVLLRLPDWLLATLLWVLIPLTALTLGTWIQDGSGEALRVLILCVGALTATALIVALGFGLLLALGAITLCYQDWRHRQK